MHVIIYESNHDWKYYLINLLTNEAYETTEEDFFQSVGFDRYIIPMHRDKENINKQNFYSDETIIGYRIRR